MGYDPLSGSLQLAAGGTAVRQRVHEVGPVELASAGSHDFTLPAGKLYAVLSCVMSASGWLRLYGSSAARSSDLRSAPGAPYPDAGSGFYAEVLAPADGGEATTVFSPVPLGQGENGVAYGRLVNTGASSSSMSASLTLCTLIR